MPRIRLIAVMFAVGGLLAASCGGSEVSIPSGDADAGAEVPPAEPVEAAQPEPSAAPEVEQDDSQPEAPTVSEPEQPSEAADTIPEVDEPATTEPVAAVEPEPVEQPESTTTLPEPDTEQVPVADPPGWCAGIQGVLDHFEAAEEALEAAYARSSEAWEAYNAALGTTEEAEAFEAAEAADNEVFEAQYQMEVANSLREELVESGRMSTGEDAESLAYQRAWAALVDADPTIAELSARVPQDIAIGLDFAVPPLVIPEGATDEEAETLEAAWRTNRRRLIEDTNELRIAIWNSFASGTMSAFLQSLEESCGAVESTTAPSEKEVEQKNDSETRGTTNFPQEGVQTEDREVPGIVEATVTAMVAIDELYRQATGLVLSDSGAEACSLRYEAREIADAHEDAFGGFVLSHDEYWAQRIDRLDEWDAACTAAGH